MKLLKISFFVLLSLTANAKSKSKAQKALDDSYYKALDAGDLAAVKKSVAAGASVNYLFDSEGPTTPLVVAIRSGSEEVVSFLLEKGADASGKINKDYPLGDAISKNNQKIIDLMLAQNVDPNDSGSDGSLLMLAAENSNPKAIEGLINKGAKVNFDDNGTTALMMASQYGCVECVKVLLDHKADKHKKGFQGKEAKDYIGEAAAKDELHKLLD